MPEKKNNFEGRSVRHVYTLTVGFVFVLRRDRGRTVGVKSADKPGLVSSRILTGRSAWHAIWLTAGVTTVKSWEVSANV